MVEVSSSDEEVDEADEPEEETTSPTARGPRAEQTSGETDAGGDDIEVEEDEEDVWGQPSEAKKRRTEVRNIRDRFEKLIADASNVQYCFWNAWHWWVLHTGWREHERHIVAHETDHGWKVKIPIFFRKIQSCGKRQKRQAPEEHHATGETMEKNQIHWEGGSDQMLLQPASIHVRHWWSWRRRSIPSEWHRSQPLWPRCEKSSWAWCTCWTSSWGISTRAANHWRAERMEPQRSWCVCKMAHWRKKTVWRQLEFQVHPTIHTWP